MRAVATVLGFGLLFAVSPGALGDDAWYRLDLQTPILFSNGDSQPTPGSNNDIEITAAASASGRVYGDLQVDVGINGIDATYVVSVTGLPGASWVSTGIGQGHISYPSAAQGTYSVTLEVRNAGGDLVASQSIGIEIYPPLTASVPQSSYAVSVGDALEITPSVANLITADAVQWGGSLPSWMSLDTSDGTVSVDTSMARSADNLILTAVDQTDFKDASTNPFSVAVAGVCEPWVARAALEQGYWHSITYGGGQFVAVAFSGARRIMTSADGIVWTTRVAPEQNYWWSVTYGDGLFVAVAITGTNRIMTSPDGVNWTTQAAPEQNSWHSVTYGNGLFVAVAESGENRVMTSPDGVNWTPQAAPGESLWQSVTYGHGKFVAVANAGTSRVMTSLDGATWTIQTTPGQNQWLSVAYGGGNFVAVGNYGDTNKSMTSTDGIMWSPKPAPELGAVAYGNGSFVAVSGSGVIMTSSCS